jgi:hypothetical protein
MSKQIRTHRDIHNLASVLCRVTFLDKTITIENGNTNVNTLVGINHYHLFSLHLVLKGQCEAWQICFIHCYVSRNLYFYYNHLFVYYMFIYSSICKEMVSVK